MFNFGPTAGMLGKMIPGMMPGMNGGQQGQGGPMSSLGGMRVPPMEAPMIDAGPSQDMQQQLMPPPPDMGIGGMPPQMGMGGGMPSPMGGSQMGMGGMSKPAMSKPPMSGKGMGMKGKQKAVKNAKSAQNGGGGMMKRFQNMSMEMGPAAGRFLLGG